MNEPRKNLISFLFIITAIMCLFTVMAAHAQTNPSAVEAGTNAPGIIGDPNATAPGVSLPKVLQPLQFLIIPLVTVIIMGVKKLVPKIPPVAWPFVAPFIGALLDYAAAKAGWVTGSPVVGAMLGGLGTWFHQTGSQTKQAISGTGDSGQPSTP